MLTIKPSSKNNALEKVRSRYAQPRNPIVGYHSPAEGVQFERLDYHLDFLISFVFSFDPHRALKKRLLIPAHCSYFL